MNASAGEQTINASGCLVLAPGLLSSAAQIDTPDSDSIGSLRYLLGLAEEVPLSETAYQSIESVVAGLLLPAEELPCAAHFTYKQDFATTHTDNHGSLLRVDPAYQQIDMNNATLGNPLELDLSSHESTALLDTLNQHFAEDGMRFTCVDPHRWYCHFDSALNITSTPVNAAIGRDVADYRPRGADSRRWRSKLAEIEMMLFAHPVNTARQQDNRLPVNTLWLWGEGVPGSPQAAKALTVFSDNLYCKGVAEFAGVVFNDLPATTATFKPAAQPVLVVVDSFTRPLAAQSDPVALKATEMPQQEAQTVGSLAWFEQIICSALWNNLHHSGWPEVSIWCGDNRLFRLRASVKKQWLRRLFYKPRPLSDFLPAVDIDQS